eukprot:4546609-Pyramimonas_sp.AAC.1
MAIRGLKLAPMCPPREVQESPTRAPGTLQERPKRGPRGDFRHSRMAMQIGAPFCLCRSSPRWPGERSQ